MHSASLTHDGVPGHDATRALLDAWNAVLDGFEAALDHADTQIRSVGDDSAHIDTSHVFRPPTSMPPFPTELAARAQALLERTASVTESAEEASARIRPSTVAHAPNAGRSANTRRSSSSPSFEAFA